MMGSLGIIVVCVLVVVVVVVVEWLLVVVGMMLDLIVELVQFTISISGGIIVIYIVWDVVGLVI